MLFHSNCTLQTLAAIVLATKIGFVNGLPAGTRSVQSAQQLSATSPSWDPSAASPAGLQGQHQISSASQAPQDARGQSSLAVDGSRSMQPESYYLQPHSVSGNPHVENSAFAFADSLLVDPYESEAETSSTDAYSPSNEASVRHVQPLTTHQDSHTVGPGTFVAQGQAAAQPSSGSSGGLDAHSLIEAWIRRLNPNGDPTVTPQDTLDRYWTARKLKEFQDSPVRKRFREPGMLKMLKYSLLAVQVDAARRFRYLESGDEARNEINSRVFNNRLVWADMNDMSAQAKRSHRKMAFGPSRVLPWVKLPAPSKSRWEQQHLREVRMTVHGAGVDSKTWNRDHPFVGQTYMEFFSMPDLRSPEDQSTIIQRHGVGYLDPAHHGEVDGFLLSALKKV